MSRFYSDLITLTTVAVAGGAILLGQVDFSATEAETADTEMDVVEVASLAEPAPIIQITDAAPEPAQVEPVRRLAIEGIQQAELLQVSFTSVEEDLFPRTASAGSARETGRVTGSTVNLRSGPGTGFAVMGRAVQDQQLPVTGNTDGSWVEVYAEGISDPVWIHGKFFRAP